MTQHKTDLERLHSLTSILLRKLEEQLIAPHLAERNIEQRVWNEKEDAISILTKLTQILTKLGIPDAVPQTDDEPEELSDDDIKMMERF